MTDERFKALMQEKADLTPEEIQEGWHFCYEFDGLLVGPGMAELDCCFCLGPNHPVYRTIPPSAHPPDDHVF